MGEAVAAIRRVAVRFQPMPPVRIPLRGNVSAGPGVRALVDAPAVQRLRGVRQLGLAHLVYPGASHSRFEHSIGVYAIGAMLCGRLRAGSRRQLPPGEARLFLAACLLHDVGHYPLSHVLEEVPPHPESGLRIRRHDERARDIILGDERVAGALRDLWGCDPERVCAIIDEHGALRTPADALLRHMLCGPLNPDRLDYLARDSLHAGVPYGSAIDLERLLSTAAFTEDGTALCVSLKGVSAVETLIFASYLMYREVYWHHTVRAAQAMWKRAAVEALRSGAITQAVLEDADDEQSMALLRGCGHPVAAELVGGLGAHRVLYRRVWSGGPADISALPPGAARDLLQELADSDAWTAAERLRDTAAGLQAQLRQPVAPHHLLWDVAGAGKELFFSVPVRTGGGYGSTADPSVSLIAPTLSSNFERHAKRMQLLARPDLIGPAARYLGLSVPRGGHRTAEG